MVKVWGCSGFSCGFFNSFVPSWVMLSYFLGKLGKLAKTAGLRLLCVFQGAQCLNSEQVSFLIDADIVQTQMQCFGVSLSSARLASVTFKAVYGCRLNTCVDRPEGHHHRVWGSFISKIAGPKCKWKQQKSQGHLTTLLSLLILLRKLAGELASCFLRTK